MFKLLVVANHTVPCPALIESVVARTRSERRHEVRVVAPALNTRLRHLFSDVDQATAAAHARLDRTLEYLGAAGIHAAGGVGDSDPFLAIQDELYTFPAQGIIISTLPPGHSNWLERGLIERARRSFTVPIRHIVSCDDIPNGTGARVGRMPTTQSELPMPAR